MGRPAKLHPWTAADPNRNSALLVKLRKTFKHLFIRNNSVHDDTLLDKLATCLESQLVEGEEKCQTTVSVLEEVGWIPALVGHTDTMNVSVVSFGLKVLGTLSRTTAGRTLLEIHAGGLRTLLGDLTREFDSKKASLRFALLHLLLQLAGCQGLSFVPAQQNLVDLARKGMSDSSIFVKRGAGDLLISLFVSPSFLHFPWNPVVIELLDSLTVAKPLGHGPPRADPQVALSVLQRFGTCRLLATSYPGLQNDLRAVMPRYVRTIVNDDFPVANYQLMIYLNVVSFNGDQPPTDWVEFLDELLSTKHVVAGEQLLIDTCKSLIKCEMQVPSWLKSAMLRPLIVASKWRPVAESSLLVNRLPAWEQRTEDFKIEDQDPSSIKLVFSVLTNVAYFDACFEDTADRLHLLDLLLHYISGSNPFIVVDLERQREKVVALQQKHQSCILFAVSRLLDEWGCDWFGSLSVTARGDLLARLGLLLHNREWTGLMAIKGLQLLKKLLPLCCHDLEQMWSSLGPQLESAFVHWYFHRDWETTDAVLEVLAVIAELGQTQGFLQQWLETTASIRIAFLALSSSNSYLNSSALSLFGSMTTIPQLIGVGGRNLPHKVFLLEDVANVLLSGSEGTVRQAAASTLYDWFKRDCILEADKNLLYGCFVIASYELYWEVKLVAVDFWDEALNAASRCKDASNDCDSLLTRLSGIGLLDAVVGLAEDEDFSVCKKISDVVLKMLAIVGPDESAPETIGRAPPTKVPAAFPPAPSSEPESELPTYSDKEKLSAIEATLNTTDIDTIDVLRSAFQSRGELGPDDSTEPPKLDSLEEQLAYIDQELQRRVRADAGREELERLVFSHRRCCAPMTPDTFVSWLQSLDAEHLREMTSHCTDLYESNWEALLDDILTVNYESDNEDDETAMDCY